ncbi:hypothetical protein MPH_05448 [Macrophomina phaseolina MS6]|uniref:DUF7580 domain-containing protein n=2 Tax=Macrophomina phaseolina TaxID=35725 RepID=K2SKR2_MACPH|nr:hypothetical protein MPH_05448 [Macrophomina phaseolina MS6]
MSGAEIAGLVLAVVPIVAAAAEHQRRVIDTANTALRPKVKDEKLASQYQHLHNEVSLLNLNIRDLISDLPSLTTDEKHKLLALEKPLWEDERVSLALAQRLGSSADAFVDTVQKILNTLDGILSDRVLKLAKSDIVQPQPTLFAKLEHLRVYGGDPKDLKGRIRFTTSDSKRRKALAALTDQNKTLERFIRHRTVPEIADISAQAGESNSWKLPPHSRARNLIHTVYDALARVWTLHCNCPSPHEARLSLCGCFAWFEGASDDELAMFISTGHEAHRAWQEGCVRIASPRPRRDSLVRFTDISRGSGTTSVASSEAGKKIHVESICAIVSQARRSNVALLVEYESNTLWHRARKRTIPKQESCITLDHLLRHQGQRKLKEKRVLAVVLAHSLLHLCDSSWLKNEWDKTHISFFRSAANQLNLKPYLHADFQALSGEIDKSAMLQLHPSPAILALGILLLELQIWEPIENKRRPEDLTDDGLENVNTNLMTAERVFMESDDEIFENYRKAVRACLNCDFLDEREVDFNDDEVRFLVYENIVAPLEKELYQGWKMGPADLVGVLA